MEITQELSALINSHCDAKLSKILDRISAPSALRSRKQTENSTLRRESLC
jgi:hypothetical protein